MVPNYWLLWEERVPNRTFSRKFYDLEGLNDFIQSLRVENLKSYEVLSGFSLKAEVYK